MEQFDGIAVPESHIAFAEAVAELAEQNNIESFKMVYCPDWQKDDGKRSWDRKVKGDATIVFRAKDGRGRPCRHLHIDVEARLSHSIESHPESSN
jgi:hypothetical protein